MMLVRLATHCPLRQAAVPRARSRDWWGVVTVCDRSVAAHWDQSRPRSPARCARHDLDPRRGLSSFRR